MSIEELLKPRYKVIADWPMNHFFDVGDIIEMKMMSNGRYWNGEDSYYLTEEQMRTFPHLFKKLEWWEERKESEMPEYVKSIKNKKVYHLIPEIRFHLSEYLPATEEEYIQYQQNKNVCQ